jgi:hypothetical protein
MSFSVQGVPDKFFLVKIGENGGAFYLDLQGSELVKKVSEIPKRLLTKT